MAVDPISLGLLGGSVLAGGLSSLLGKSGKMRRTPRFSSEQEQALNTILQRGMENTDINALEERARQQYEQETVPSLAERFTSLGAGGQRSSAFQGALGRSGTNLQNQLAQLRAQYGMQQLGMGLTPRFETYYQSGGPTFASGTLQGLGSGLGQLGFMGLGKSMGLYGGGLGAPQAAGAASSDLISQLTSLLGGASSRQPEYSLTPLKTSLPLTPQQGQANFEQYLRNLL